MALDPYQFEAMPPLYVSAVTPEGLTLAMDDTYFATVGSGITGSGTTNKAAKWTSSGAIGDGNITFEADGTSLINNGIGLASTYLTITAATHNDYTIESSINGANLFWLKVSGAGAATITGLDVSGLTIANGRTLIIGCYSGSVTLKDNDAGSTAANRLLLGADIVLSGNKTATLSYFNDGTTTGWIPIAKT